MKTLKALWEMYWNQHWIARIVILLMIYAVFFGNSDCSMIRGECL